MYAHFLAQSGCDAVGALCEGQLQAHAGTGIVAAGVVWCPLLDGSFDGVVDGVPLIDAAVTGFEALVHGLGIDEELEGGAGLPLGRDLVIFPEIEADVAHPRTDEACVRFYGHEAAV